VNRVGERRRIPRFHDRDVPDDDGLERSSPVVGRDLADPIDHVASFDDFAETVVA